MDAYSVLQTYFGYTAFRPGQKAVIDALLSGRDAFAIMPTGGGKSVCYQVPALLLPGLTLVISPLISLMQDQVTALRDTGVPAAFLNSSLSGPQAREVFREVHSGRCKLLYVAPERLAAEGFLSLMQELPPSLVAVDEAHCISQWGQDFRPHYLKIVEFLEKLSRRPVLSAFTATATEQVRQDVERILTLREPLRVVTGFDRPNLKLEVLRPQEKGAALLTLLRRYRGQSGIVYCATRNKVEQVCEDLRAAGIAATRYHAGLLEAERRDNQTDFIEDRSPVMVATNAFGMGIDKSNVRFVIHYNMPKSLEAYYQEAGRAGRDGEAAECVLLYSAGDVRTARYLIENGGENKELTDEERRQIQRQDLERLSAMTGYCRTQSCLRGYLLDYFGESHPPHCGNCGSCLEQFQAVDITREAQMILSCVRRVRDKLGYGVGSTLLIQTLCGSQDQRVRQLGLDELSTWGLMKEMSRSRIHSCLEHLESEGYLRTDPVHSAIDLTDRARQVLFRGESVTLLQKKEAPAPKRRADAELSERDQALLDQLKDLRRELAVREHLAAYMVFSDATLMDMVRKKPRNSLELRQVSGVGEVKAGRYGRAFLACIAENG
ncbi:MAG: DNA helicase RecQ [Oscillibacter sp.]|nr:DNA helicase RecQ [Oscillibacter sp.]